jgi:hypothetical protein
MDLRSLTLETPDGSAISLDSFLTSEHLLVVFLRHLA